MSEPLKFGDPAAWMLLKGIEEQQKVDSGEIEESKWISKTTVYKAGCYICEDKEFALMGLPLCFPCIECGGHVAADDEECDEGHTSNPYNREFKGGSFEEDFFCKPTGTYTDSIKQVAESFVRSTGGPDEERISAQEYLDRYHGQEE